MGSSRIHEASRKEIQTVGVILMASEDVKAEDEVTLVLYDKDGKVKQTCSSKKKRTKLERFANLIRFVFEKW